MRRAAQTQYRYADNILLGKGGDLVVTPVPRSFLPTMD